MRICDGIQYDECLTNVQIVPCEAETLGCGLIQVFNDEYGCYTWSPLAQLDDLILIDDLNGYASGDTVYASGVRTGLGDICICGCGWLLHTRLSACPDTASAVSHVSWGRLKAIFRE